MRLKTETHILYAKHNFHAVSSDELSFQKGDVIEVIETDHEYNDGWYTGRNPKGEIGIFPVNFTSKEAIAESNRTSSGSIDEKLLEPSLTSPSSLQVGSETNEKKNSSENEYFSDDILTPEESSFNENIYELYATEENAGEILHPNINSNPKKIYGKFSSFWSNKRDTEDDEKMELALREVDIEKSNYKGFVAIRTIQSGGWKNMYAVLVNSKIFFFKLNLNGSPSKKCRFVIFLSPLITSIAPDSSTFFSEKYRNRFVIKGEEDQMYLISTKTQLEMMLWIKEILKSFGPHHEGLMTLTPIMCQQRQLKMPLSEESCSLALPRLLVQKSAENSKVETKQPKETKENFNPILKPAKFMKRVSSGVVSVQNDVDSCEF